MDNNKNLMRTEDKSKSEIQKMFPQAGASEFNSLNNVKKSHKQQGQSLKNTTTRD